MDTPRKPKDILSHAAEIQAIAQVGLAYCNEPYDIERYKQLMTIATEMIAGHTKRDYNAINIEFLTQLGYACPKVDIRSFILKEGQVLLVQEKQDSKWSLPGGWADVNYSPAECAEKETKEETGLDCKATRLLALWDTTCHDHPRHWPYIYKCVFACEIIGEEKFAPEHDIQDVNYFSLDNLPPLSRYRITERQLLKLAKLYHSTGLPTEFD